MVGWNFSAGLISLDKTQFHCSAFIILILCMLVVIIHHSPCILPDLQASQFCNIFTFPVCSEPGFHNAPHLCQDLVVTSSFCFFIITLFSSEEVQDMSAWWWCAQSLQHVSSVLHDMACCGVRKANPSPIISSDTYHRRTLLKFLPYRCQCYRCCI